jgi:hypothetical protein
MARLSAVMAAEALRMRLGVTRGAGKSGEIGVAVRRSPFAAESSSLKIRE